MLYKRHNGQQVQGIVDAFIVLDTRKDKKKGEGG